MFDLKIFIHSDVDNCVERLKVRNLCIPGYTPEEIQIRCEEVDRVNAMTVLRSKARADIIVESIVSKPKPNPPSSLHPMLKSRDRLSSDALNLMSFDQQPETPRQHHVTESRQSHFLSSAVTSSFRSSDSEPASQGVEIKHTPSWEADQAARILENLSKAETLPYMVALVGTPGSGKSVSSFLLANNLEQQGVRCMIMPHDGYHYTLEYLKTFPDSEDVIYRRGAPDTFDPSSLLRDLQRIKTGEEEFLTVPGFDHAKGDPEPDKHAFDRSKHKVVICEGLYLLHDKDGWEAIANVFDWKIFMNSDIDICMDRVKIRNQCIPGYTREEIFERVDKVDRVNALTVLRSKARADVVVDSLAMKK